ncbi:hypothetical protein [Streptomyces sp. NPDC058385]|uniref:hypothetical protein n=1 Tax=Streptomyces sp. NPDC058385 TaxID=3346473 RepID=UPI003651FEAE
MDVSLCGLGVIGIVVLRATAGISIVLSDHLITTRRHVERSCGIRGTRRVDLGNTVFQDSS